LPDVTPQEQVTLRKHNKWLNSTFEQVEYVKGGGLAQLVTSLVASTPGPV